MAPIRVVFAGPAGRTGRATGAALDLMPDVEVVGAVGLRSAGRDLGELWHGRPDGRVVHASLAEALSVLDPQVLCDFTTAEAARDHLRLALLAGVRPVVGTTGLSPDVLREAAELCQARGLSAAVIANFSVVAFVLERVAQMALPFFDGVELIELHNAAKRDKPSGTALRLQHALEAQVEREVPVHSVRLQGLVAHQEVWLGKSGEVLTLRHDVLDRSCYAEGLRRVVLGIADRAGVVTELGAFLPPLA